MLFKAINSEGGYALCPGRSGLCFGSTGHEFSCLHRMFAVNWQPRCLCTHTAVGH